MVHFSPFFSILEKKREKMKHGRNSARKDRPNLWSSKGLFRQRNSIIIKVEWKKVKKKDDSQVHQTGNVCTITIRFSFQEVSCYRTNEIRIKLSREISESWWISKCIMPLHIESSWSCRHARSENVVILEKSHTESIDVYRINTGITVRRRWSYFAVNRQLISMINHR